MDVKWDYQLKGDQRTNPILHVEKDVLDYTYQFDENAFNQVLAGKGHQLKTWGNAESTSEPHWIGVKKQTPLHTDPRYPRYTWHLILRVDNFAIRGLDKVETKLENNMLICLDTHSPHQLLSLSNESMYYFACSIDSKQLMAKSKAKEKILEYVNSNTLLSHVDRISK